MTNPSLGIPWLVLIVLMLGCGVAPKAPVAVAESSVVTLPVELGSFTRAEFEAHVKQLKKRLPSKEFTIVVQPPFVVVGDEPADVVKKRSEETIRWAVDKLKQD